MNESDTSIPLVSICCVTYNHERFISQCLDGFVMQQTNFAFEILVHEDASTDRTVEIIKEYEKKYPHLFRCVYQTVNQFKIQNTLTNILFPMARGKYIALCEGDDYWTDPYKLQSQVDFLEDNSDFVICYHPVNVLFPDGHIEEDYLVKGSIEKQESTIYDLAVLGNYIHTPSVVFRNVYTEYPESMNKTSIGDFFLWMLLAQYGKIKKLPDVMAVYRFGVGVHSSQSEKFRQAAFLKTLSLLSETIEDKTIVEILKNRIATIKSFSLPYTVRGLNDYGDLVKAENLKDYVSYDQLIKAAWLKILRKFG